MELMDSLPQNGDNATYDTAFLRKIGQLPPLDDDADMEGADELFRLDEMDRRIARDADDRSRLLRAEADYLGGH